MMNSLERYIGDLDDVKFWFNADLYNGDGVALPSDGSVISGSTNLPKDLKSNTEMSYIGSLNSQAIFKSNPNRVELTTQFSNNNTNVLYKYIESSYISNNWVCWVVGSFIDSSYDRARIFSFNNNVNYVLSKEPNTPSITGGYYPVPVFCSIYVNPLSSGTLASPEIVFREQLTTPTIYKIKNNGTVIRMTTNSIKSRVYNELELIQLSQINFGNWDGSQDLKIANCNIYECIYINTNNITSEKQIDSYLKLKYNV